MYNRDHPVQLARARRWCLCGGIGAGGPDWLSTKRPARCSMPARTTSVHRTTRPRPASKPGVYVPGGAPAGPTPPRAVRSSADSRSSAAAAVAASRDREGNDALVSRAAAEVAAQRFPI